MLNPYQKLLADLGVLLSSLEHHHAQNMVCQKGCDQCCIQDLSVFEVEAQPIREALKNLPKASQTQIQTQASKDVDHCPMLIDHACSIYEARPVICRTHGLPIAFQPKDAEEGEVFLDVCPLNFTAEGSLENLSLGEMLDIDRLNLRLAAVNMVHCRDTLGDIEKAHERISLKELIHESVS